MATRPPKAAPATMGDATAAKPEPIVIKALNIGVMTFTIRGTAPYVGNAFSEKARATIIEKQEKGTQRSTRTKEREAKDFEACFRAATHTSQKGWHGIPANAFRKAMIAACRTCDFSMKHAKLAIFIQADGLDKTDLMPLVRITKGTPRHVKHHVRLSETTTDIRSRPMWDEGWEADVTIRFDAGMFKPSDIANLLHRAGFQVGVGEGRADSESGGVGWGFFEIVA